MNEDLFRTKVDIPKSEFEFGYQKKAMMIKTKPKIVMEI